MKLINASDLKLYIMRHLLIDENSTTEEIERQMLRAIDVQPAIDAKVVRHGRWVWFEDWSPSTIDHPADCDDCGWRCENCKQALEDMVGGYWDNPDEIPQLAYCPNCGAKMDKEKSE